MRAQWHRPLPSPWGEGGPLAVDEVFCHFHLISQLSLTALPVGSRSAALICHRHIIHYRWLRFAYLKEKPCLRIYHFCAKRSFIYVEAGGEEEGNQMGNIFYNSFIFCSYFLHALFKTLFYHIYRKATEAVSRRLSRTDWSVCAQILFSTSLRLFKPVDITQGFDSWLYHE